MEEIYNMVSFCGKLYFWWYLTFVWSCQPASLLEFTHNSLNSKRSWESTPLLRCVISHPHINLHQWMWAVRGSVQILSQGSIRFPPGMLRLLMLCWSMAQTAYALRTDGEHRWLSPKLFTHFKWRRTQCQVSYLCSCNCTHNICEN